MIDPSSIDFGKLKSAVKALNEAGVLETAIKFIGTGKEALATAFGAAIDGLPDEKFEKINTIAEITEMYEILFPEVAEGAAVDGVAAAAPAPAPAEKPEKVKKEKPPKDPSAPPKEKKAQAPRGPFGSTIGSAANGIDELIAAGSTIEDIMAKADVSRSRIGTHIKFLEKERGVVITKSEDGNSVKGVLAVK